MRSTSVSAPAATSPSPDGETSARTMPEALPVGPPASPGDGVALSGAAAALSAARTSRYGYGKIVPDALTRG